MIRYSCVGLARLELCIASRAQALISELDASLPKRTDEQRYGMLHEVWI